MSDENKSKLFPDPYKTAEEIFAQHNVNLEEVNKTQRMFSVVIFGSLIVWIVILCIGGYVAYHFISKFW
jgi:hypothetical protein